MYSKNIINVLVEHQFNMTKNSNPQYKFFCKQTDDSFSTVILIDDIKFQNKTDELILASIKESLEKTFLLRGFRQVDVMFIIFTNNPFSYKELAAHDFPFWVADVNYGRLISYASNDDNFAYLRNDFENALAGTPKKTSVFSRIKESNGVINPIFAIIFALANTLVFTGMELFGDITDMAYMYAHGTCQWKLVLESGEYYRLLTSMFIHFSFPHLVSNMTSLLAIGSQLEPSCGHIRFIIIYILSGLAGSLTSVFYHSYMDMNIISAGASGAVFGIFGAYAVYALFDKLKGRHVSASSIALISLLVLYNGMISSDIDNAAHLGGIISGCLIAFICCICSKNKI